MRAEGSSTRVTAILECEPQKIAPSDGWQDLFGIARQRVSRNMVNTRAGDGASSPLVHVSWVRGHPYHRRHELRRVRP